MLTDFLIDTLLQRGVRCNCRLENRFNGLPHGTETVETVFYSVTPINTPPKQGVTGRKLMQFGEC
jgi:hypothetical protein